MPDACNPVELAAAAACYVCLDAHMQRAIRVRLLCAILNGETMSCDPANLSSAAACIACGMDAQMMQAVEVSLLCQIAASGGGGGGAAILQGDVNPSVAPVGGNGIYYNRTDSSLWIWDSNLSTWVKIIG